MLKANIHPQMNELDEENQDDTYIIHLGVPYRFFFIINHSYPEKRV